MQRFDVYMKAKGLNDNKVTEQCNLSQGLLAHYINRGFSNPAQLQTGLPSCKELQVDYSNICSEATHTPSTRL